MAHKDISNNYLGRWVGTNELYFTGPPTPDNVSDSALLVEIVATGKFLSFTYTWELKGVSHEGVLLIGLGSAECAATAAWVDSFHMSAKIMHSEGSVAESGKVSVLGYYEAPPGPDWGWRTEIESDGKALQMTMYNIMPDGEEALAVDAKYSRVP